MSIITAIYFNALFCQKEKSPRSILKREPFGFVLVSANNVYAHRFSCIGISYLDSVKYKVFCYFLKTGSCPSRISQIFKSHFNVSI